MKESIWMYFFATMGMTGIVLINIFGQIIVSNEQNYYLLKEVTEAAMYDAVDLYAIRNGVGYDGVTDSSDPESMHCISYKPGTVRIIKEKFVENFIRRFAENAELNRNYRVVIHDIDECPPKVSLSLVATNNFDFVTFLSVDFNNGETAGGADIVNSLSGILETVSGWLSVEPVVGCIWSNLKKFFNVKNANIKYKYRQRTFLVRSYYVSTVWLNKNSIKKYI